MQQNIVRIAELTTNLVKSTDRLFFVAYSQPSQARKECKLVQVDPKNSIRLNNACLQNGKFIIKFFIRHYNDDHVNLPEQRYWIEYHRSDDDIKLSHQYHLITPSPMSEEIASKKNLIPYIEWMNLTDNDINIHGPFDFAMING